MTVAKVATDFDRQEFVVEHDERASRDALLEEVQGLGFRASIVPADAREAS